MDIKARYDNISHKDNGKAYLTFEIDKQDAEWLAIRLRKLIEKELSLSIEVYRNKRSNNANAYAWVLMQKIAKVLNSSKDEIYLIMLERYSSKFIDEIVPPENVAAVKKKWRTSIELGVVTVGGTTGVELQLYFGSSTFNTEEMSVFINGIVSECQELDIETKPEEEIKSLCEEWNNEQKNKSDKHKRKSKAGSNRT